MHPRSWHRQGGAKSEKAESIEQVTARGRAARQTVQFERRQAEQLSGVIDDAIEWRDS